MSCMEVMRMLGVGRRQFEVEAGSGIIITFSKERMYYQSLMTDQLRLESQFISKLADQLNAEIVLGTVQNAMMACDWLSHTFLYFRMQRNPKLYGLFLAGNKALEGRIADLIHSAATILDKNKMVIYDRKGGNFQVTELGRIASCYRIAHGTIATFNQKLRPAMRDVDICSLLSLSEELKYVEVRPGEGSRSRKIKVLLQGYISFELYESSKLRSEMFYIAEVVERLAPALCQMIVQLRGQGRGCDQLAKQARDMTAQIRNRMAIDEIPHN